MKKGILSIILLVLSLVVLIGCTGGETTSAHTHLDKNKDGKCDVCGYVMEEVEKEFSVQFNLNYQGAPKAEKIMVKEKEKVTQPENPTREGYLFLGWFKDSKGKNAFDFNTEITKNTVIYAVWKDTKLKVTFNLNYENTESFDVDGKIGEKITLPTEPARENYRFDGWFKDENGTQAFDANEVLNESLSLYAKWTKVKDYVTYNFNYDGAPENEVVLANLNQNLTFIANPTKENYRFDGWFTEAACTNEFKSTDIFTEAMTLYAKWTKVKDYVTYNFNYDGAPENEVVLADLNQALSFPTSLPQRDVYKITGWYLEAACTNEFKATDLFTEPITLYAKWERYKDDVTYNFNYDGAPENEVVLSEFGKVLSFIENPTRENYRFDGWFTEAACTNEFKATDIFTEAMTLYAKWTKVKDYVTYNFNYEGAPDDEVVLADLNQTLTFIANPTRENYRFDGWFTEAACTNEFKTTDLFTEPITLYAKWTMTHAVFTLDLNYEGSTNPTQTIALGESATRPENPRRRNYEFINWYSDKECTTLYDFSNPVNDNMSIYAKWNQTMLAVTFDLGYEGATPIEEQSIAFDSSATRPAQDPVRERYEFVNWYKDKALTTLFDFTEIISQDTVIYAKWNQLVAIVTFNSNYEGSQSSTQNINVNNKLESLPILTRENYRFDGWFKDESGTQTFDKDTLIIEDITLYAKWTKVKDYVTFNFNFEGAPANEVVLADLNQTLTFIANPTRENYRFDGWYLEAACTNEFKATDIFAEAMTLYAKWTKVKDYVTYNFNYEGAPANEVVLADLNQTLTFIANPTRTNYEFLGWFTEAACTNEFKATDLFTEVMTLYAKWDLANRTVTFDLNYTGAPAATTSKVKHGSAVTKPTDPERSGYNFIKWQLNGNDYDFSTPVTQDITLKAVFEEIQTNATVTFDLNYNDAPNNGILGTDTVEIGAKATKPTNPSRGTYTFDNWYTESECTNVFDFDTEITSDITLFAHWFEKYVFEAEYTDIAEKGGKGYSCEAFGVSMIDVPELHRQDGNEANPPTPSNASNNAWISYLYYEESTLEFIIHADYECDAIASMWISCEFFDMTFNPTVYQFRVNGVSQAYASITLNGHDHGFNATRAEFVEVKMTNKIHLQEGENRITLVATNDHNHGGTMTADAPMVDCIVLYADEGVLSWNPITENMTEFYKQLNN